MIRKTFTLLLILTLLLLSACSEKTALSEHPEVSSAQPAVSPTPEIIEFFNDPYVFRVDLPGLINNSDTIALARVEETFPAELRIESDMKWVYTPANIKVIQSLKGDYRPGDIFRIDQLGGIAGGVDFRPATMSFHKNGETYLFFIVSAYGNVLNSEHVTAGNMLKGYFFDGKTTDEAVSMIGDCIRNGRTESNNN